MSKEKNKLNHNKREYLYIAICILLVIFCILLIGRVGKLSIIYLFISFIFGDFTSLLLLITLISAIASLIFKKKFDYHHIYFIAGVLMYISASLFCTLGLYSPLNMTNKTILSKTFDLYSRYLKSYDMSYSVGGGIIVTALAQLIGLISGKIGIILVAGSLLVIGGSYVIDIDVFKILRGGKIKLAATSLKDKLFGYVKNIHYPDGDKALKIPLTILMDNEEPVSFVLQQQINKRIYDDLIEYIKDKRLSLLPIGFNTSYTSSRFIVRAPNKALGIDADICQFFEKNCFLIKNGLDINIEIANQFKKLLTLKSVLLSHGRKNEFILGIDIDNNALGIDLYVGRALVILGDSASGIKTFIRGYLASLLIKGYKEKSIYFFDFNSEFKILSTTKMHYANDYKAASVIIDEIFTEYEKRSEAFKYLDVDNLIDANKAIKQMGPEFEAMGPIFHIFFLKADIQLDMLKKLSYLIQLAPKVGMSLFIVVRDKADLLKLNLSNCEILSFNISDLSTSVKLFGSDMACRLQKKGDLIYQCQGKIYHGQSPYVSLDDFEKIIYRL